MSITWTEDGDSRVDLGPSCIQQVNLANFSASDYSTGGYPVNPQAFGLARLRGAWLVGVAGTAVATVGGYDWVLDRTGATSTPPTWKLRAFSTGTVEASTGTDFSGLTLSIKAEGPY